MTLAAKVVDLSAAITVLSTKLDTIIANQAAGQSPVDLTEVKADLAAIKGQVTPADEQPQ